MDQSISANKEPVSSESVPAVSEEAAKVQVKIEEPAIAPTNHEETTTTPSPKRQKLEEQPSEELNSPPIHEIVGGSSIRQYLNKHLTKHLIEGLRIIGDTKPEDPLKYLGEFLINRSNELKQSDNQ